MSRVDAYLQEGELQIGNFNFEVIETSGHAHEQYALCYQNNLFAADALFGTEILERYPLPYGQDIGKQIASAEKLRKFAPQCQQVIMGHGSPSNSLNNLISANLNAFQKICEVIYRIAKDGLSTEQIFLKACQEFAISIKDIPRYYLNYGVVLAYLSYLRAEEQLEVGILNNQPIWQST